jgi:branched-chain amino acid transport system substrate-binding protein
MKFAFCYWLLALGLSGCSTTAEKKSEAPPASIQVQQEYEKAVQFRKSQPQTSLKILNNIVKDHGHSSVADKSALLMGNILEETGRPVEAQRAYDWILTWSFRSSVESMARIRLSHLYLRADQPQKALETIQPALDDASLSEDHKIAAWNQFAEALSKTTTDPLVLVRTFHKISQNHPVATERDRYSIRTLEIIESQLNEDQLSTVARDRNLGYARVPALFQHGMNLFEQGDYSRAMSALQEARALAPSSRYAEHAQEIIEQIQARRRVDSKTIGLVVPLSGPMTRIGERTLHGAQLALGTFSDSNSDYVLAVADSEGNPDAARRAVEKLVAEDHAIAIVGSLLSKTAVAVASKANELGVPTIGLSQKSGLTEIGSFVFRNAMTSQMQVKHLVKIAMEDQGMKRFAILFPNDPYGVEYANLFWDEVVARGGTIAGAQSYPSGSTDFNDAIKKLVGTYYIEDRMVEYRQALKAWSDANPTKTARNQPPPDLLKPIVDFEALFIPDTPKASGLIAPTLAYNSIKDLKLIGTNLWNHEDFVTRGGRYVENSIFVDSFLQSDPRFVGSRFYQDFQRTFGYAPGIFEVQAYDSVMLLKNLLDGGPRSRSDLLEKLSRVNSFEGALGYIQLDDSREFQRPLIGLTVRNQKIQPLEETRP